MEYGGVFCSLEWLSQYDQRIQICGIYNKDNALIGAFNLYRGSLFGARHIKTAPYTPNIGLFYVNSSSNSSKRTSFDKAVIKLIADYVSGLSWSVVTLPLPSNIVDVQPFLWHKFKVSWQYTYLLDLTLDETELRAGMSPERRNEIKKAEKDGIVCELSNDYTEVQQIVEKTFARTKLSVEKSDLENLLFKYCNPLNSFAFLSKHNTEVVAASLVIHDHKKAYYILGGYDQALKHGGAGALAVWNAILHAKNLGLSVFDFEGSQIPQVEKYFREFGGAITPSAYVLKAKLWLELLLKFAERDKF